jgi:group I intron endonuclease
MEKKTGIYKIKNIINNKVYIGSSVDIEKRWFIHLNSLKNGKHHSKKLQNSTKKYGIENFLFEVVEECSEKTLIERELYWVSKFDSFENGYNMVLPNIEGGFCMTEEVRNKISKTMQQKRTGKTYEELYGKRKAEDIKRKMSESQTGKKMSEDSKKKTSEARKGIKFSEEHKNKLRERKKGHIPWNKGKKLSKEHVEKLRESHIGNSLTEETKRKMIMTRLINKKLKSK